MAEKINIRLPLDLLELAGLSSENFEKKSKLVWTLELYSQGKITVSKAASLVDMKVNQFLHEFRKRHLVHIGGPQSLEEAKEDFSVVIEQVQGKRNVENK